MSRTRTATGTVQSISKVALGSTLAANAAISATTITVTDTTDFDAENGGTVSIVGALYTYSAVDEDAGTIHLSPGLAAAAFEGDRVDIWDTASNLGAVEWRALIELPGEVNNADSLDAIVALPLVTLLPEGLREPGTGETVTLENRDEEWVVSDAQGTAPQIQGASYPATITNWAGARTPGEYLSIEGFSVDSPDDAKSWVGTVHGRGIPGTFPNTGEAVVQVVHRIDAAGSVHSGFPETWTRYTNGVGAWMAWFQVVGWGNDVTTGIFTAAAGVTILSQRGRIEGNWVSVYCSYSVAAGLGTPITVPTDGDIGNTTVLNIAAAYQSAMGFATWPLSSAGIGRTATHVVSGTTIKLASVAGSANIVSGDSFSFAGRYPLS